MFVYIYVDGKREAIKQMLSNKNIVCYELITHSVVSEMLISYMSILITKPRAKLRRSK